MSTTVMAPAVPASSALITDAVPPSLARGDRLEVLDVLRGIALLGMYVVHFYDYGTARQGSADQKSPLWQQLEWWFLDGRAYTMFAMLFGIGFAVQLARADARGENLVPRYLRRLGALAAFGFVAEGVFGYNVLFGYAVWGLALLPIRRWPTRTIFALLLLCCAFRSFYNITRSAIAESRGQLAEYRANERAKAQSFQAAIQVKDSAEKTGSFPVVVAARTRFMWRFQRQWTWDPGGSFALMLAGLLAFRLGILEDPARRRKVILWWMLAGAASFVVAMWGFPLPGAPRFAPVVRSSTPVRDMVFAIFMNNGFRIPRDSWLAFVYIGAVLLLIAHNRVWLRRLAPFAWNGRMALANYMTQVMLLDVMFSHWSFDVAVAPRWILPGALGLFAVQAVISRWWLARFEYGPLEWLWRSVTYWRLAPFRRRVPAHPGGERVSDGLFGAAQS